MVLRLAEHLQIPVRERNTLLLAAGHAPAYPAHTLDDPEMHAVRAALDVLVDGHEPYPALVLDAGWDVIRANDAFRRILSGVHFTLLEPPMNVVRLALHPEGLAPSIINLDDWQRHLLGRLRHQVAVTGHPRLVALLAEVESYPASERIEQDSRQAEQPPDLVMALHLRLPGYELRLFTTVASFGTPLDATVSELAIETFFPADDVTKAALLAAVPRSS